MSKLPCVTKPAKRTEDEAKRARELRAIHESAVIKRREEARRKAAQPSPVRKSTEPAAEKVQAIPDIAVTDTSTPLPQPPGPVRHAAKPKRAGKQRAKAASAGAETKHLPAPPKSDTVPSTGAPHRRHRVDPEPAPARWSPRIPSLIDPARPGSLQEAFQSFMLDRQIMNCTPHTLSNYEERLAPLITYLETHGVSEPGQITPFLLRGYFAERMARKLAASTEKGFDTATRAFCNFLVREEIIAKSPMARLSAPRLPVEIKPAFTVEEINLLLQAAQNTRFSARDEAILLALLDSGCRASEFVALNFGDVNLETGAVTIRCGKGRKGRITFIGVRTRAAVARYLATDPPTTPEDPLWLGAWGDRLTDKGLNELLGRLARRAGVTNVHAHRFRRTFALWSLRAGMNIYSLQMLMGHADLHILRRYLALVEADLEKAHAEHGAVDSMLRNGSEGKQP
jgi:site-specific recombinase XerD